MNLLAKFWKSPTSCFTPSMFEMRRGCHHSTHLMAPFVKDGIFKAVFLDKQSPRKLMSFLEAIENDGVDSAPRKIERVEFQDSYFPAYSPGEKDIYVEPNPTIYVLEMQQAEQEGYVKRWDFYASRCYTNELLKAKKYDQLLKVHVIALMSFPTKYPSDTYCLVGKNTGKTIEESRTLSLLSLADLSVDLTEADCMKKKWCHLIKYSGSERINLPILKKDPILSEAIDDLYKLSSQKSSKLQSRVSKGMPWHLTQRMIQDRIGNQNRS
jgi:predicted transposase/invertase (TIGR01784 family)